MIVNVIGEKMQLRIAAFPKIQNRYFFAVSVGTDQDLGKILGEKSREERRHGVEIERQGNRIPLHHPQNAMVIQTPLREAGKVLPDLFAVGVKDMRSVFVDSQTMASDVVEGVARDVIAPVDHQDGL